MRAVGDLIVRLSTMETESEVLREVVAVLSDMRGGNGRSSLGDSGEKEGNEVRDLSDMEEVELET